MDSVAGPIPLAVAVVDAEGLVSHWSPGADTLFGAPPGGAVGRPAGDLLPVAGALAPAGEYAAYGLDAAPAPAAGAPPDSRPAPMAGRARLQDAGREPLDVVWWGYPLIGRAGDRLLVLAAATASFCGTDGPERTDRPGQPEHRGHRDRPEHPPGPHRAQGTDGPRGTEGVRRIAPGFALAADHPGADLLARWLAGSLPAASAPETARTVARILDLGCPVVELSRYERIPVTPGGGARARRFPAGAV
ncbi:hypothetical protein ABT354_09975 [Streptomyces sp. NPDC000594]|uniref:hypothetical protein n=1 Tax=Streptomyces sp. NPDC000594 TaxID=3154261 RepID=UPI003322B953